MNPNHIVEPLEFRRLFASAYSNGMNLNDEAVSAQHIAYSLAEMKNLGVTSVRIWLSIDSYADRPNTWDVDPRAGQVDMNGLAVSSGYAGAMARAFQLKKLGYHVLLTVTPDQGLVPASAADTVGFFQHLVDATETPDSSLRLRDVVDQWEIGNEPDSQGYWADPSGNKATRLQSYVDKLLLPAAAVLHSGDPSTWEQVVSAGVSFSPDDLKTVLSYLSSKNQLGAIDYAGFHPYGTYDPDTGANQQATNILLAKQYADSYGKQMIATEWSVRGYSNTGTQDAKYARALDLNYRNYILPNFDSAYYFALVNNWAARGGTTSARPAGVLEHVDTTGISPSIHPDLIGDYFASPLVRSQPFYSTFQGWDAVTPDPDPVAGSAIVGAVWYDFNGDGVVSDQERLAGGQQVWVDLNGDRIHDPSEPSAISDSNGTFRIEYPPELVGASGAIRVDSAYPQTAAPVVTLSAITQLLNVSVGIKPDFDPPARVKGSITGSLWNDANNNGVHEAAETAAAGRIVYIDVNNDGVRQLEEYAVLTDATGRYMLRYLDAGTYTVRVQGPAGEIAQSSVIVLAQDQRLLNQDLAVAPGGPIQDPASVTLEGELAVLTGGTAKGSGNTGFTGTGFADFGGNGSAAQWTTTRNAAGTVSLQFRYANGGTTDRPLTISVNGVVIGTLSFPATGSWTTWKTVSITANLVAGANTIKAVAGVATGANVDSLTILSSSTPPPPLTGNISGVTFDDANQNGAYDATESTTIGKTVFIDLDNDGVLDANEQRVVTTTGGAWSFTALPAGNYAVRQVFDSGTEISTPLINVALTAGQTLSGLTIGTKASIVTPPSDPASVTIEAETGTLTGGTAKASGNGGFTGTGFADFGGNGSAAQWGITRQGAGTVSIDFRYANGGTTDRPLTISVNGVVLGTFSFPATGSWTTWKTVSITANLVAGANTIKAVAGVATGANVDSLTILTGSTPPPPPPGSISGFTFDDADNDGVYDATETKTAGKTVFIDLDGDGALDANEQSVLTGAGGVWTFAAMPPGTYAVRQVFASGTALSTPLINVTLATGQVVSGLSIGTKSTATPPPPPGNASISGNAFNDNNNNAKYDTGDGIGKGVTMFLDTDNDGVLDAGETSVVTDSNGKFVFSGLAAGTYSVRRVLSAGQAYSTPAANISLTTGQVKTGVLVGTKKV